MKTSCIILSKKSVLSQHLQNSLAEVHKELWDENIKPQVCQRSSKQCRSVRLHFQKSLFNAYNLNLLELCNFIEVKYMGIFQLGNLLHTVVLFTSSEIY